MFLCQTVHTMASYRIVIHIKQFTKFRTSVVPYYTLFALYEHQSILFPGEHSTLLVSFHLQRHMGNFVIQVYGPCMLLVVISWVSFWMDVDSVPGRTTLGVTTLLTVSSKSAGE